MLKNIAYSGVSAGSAALLLLLLALAGHTLGGADFGKFAFALALGTVFETLMDFGLHQVTIRAVARDPARANLLLRHTLGIKLMWATGALVALCAAATILRADWDVRIACYLIGGATVMRSYMLTIRGVLQGLERFGWDSLVVIADRGLLLVLGAAALLGGGGLRGLAVAFVVARGLAVAASAWMTHEHLGGFGLKYDRDLWRELQAEALPLGFFLVVLNLYSYIDGVMLGVMRTDLETGHYTAAYRVYEGLTYGAGAIAAVLTPRLAALFSSDHKAHLRLALTGLAGSVGVSVAVAAAAWLLAPQIVVIVFGPQFAPAASPLRILAAGLTFVYAIWVLHAVALSVNRERLLLQTGVIGLVVNVALNLYLIPAQGAQGAAIATVAGEVVSMAVLVAGLRRRG